MGVPAVAVDTIADFVAALKLGLVSEHPLLIEVAADATFGG